ncbi:hypothetical protein WR25_07428 [Diploscapter pachys]|uniref:Peptidase C1A papain C-terminal domain-containing protein n=1 Tax=Diploscapter pachys TaxID=2018661 RepID=A0A2A2KXS7_9BILA|nr:hypothetical protein WR25_07428 [Diploscapter pachys]
MTIVTNLNPNEKLLNENENSELQRKTWKQRVNGILILLQIALIGLMIILVVFNVYSEFTYQPETVSPDVVRIKGLFNEFVQKYGKKYDSPREKLRRFNIFYSNVLSYEEEERKNPELDLDVTEFADRTDEELKMILLAYENDSILEGTYPRKSENYQPIPNRPENHNWNEQGKVTAVKNQQQCGSCWAFATVAAVESGLAIKNGTLLSLSEQEMVDCDRSNNGCHGGVRAYAMRFVQKNGLVPEQTYPYTAEEDAQCHLKKDKNDSRIFINNYELLGKSEDQIADWVYSKGPVTFGMNVTRFLYYYRNGIFTPDPKDCTQNSLGSHAMTLVGYGKDANTGNLFWVVKNSWGQYWGENGFFKLARNVNACGMANNVVAAIL